jgi:hypothetical protein
LTIFFRLSCILSKERDLPSFIKTAPIPRPEASHSTIKEIVKAGVFRTGAVHIAALSFSKYLVASFVQENASFSNNVFRGVPILA